jgi:hypothetical protein
MITLLKPLGNELTENTIKEKDNNINKTNKVFFFIYSP